MMVAPLRLIAAASAIASFTLPAAAQQAAKALPEKPAQVFPAGLYPLTPERERALKPKDSFKECDQCPEMVVVPKGAFTMGTPPKEEGRFDEEFPLHKVTIPQAFAVG